MEMKLDKIQLALQEQKRRNAAALRKRVLWMQEHKPPGLAVELWFQRLEELEKELP